MAKKQNKKESKEMGGEHIVNKRGGDVFGGFLIFKSRK